jgi:hypothetical protein
MPLHCGWNAVVVMWSVDSVPSRWHKAAHTTDVNCRPMSVVTTAGTPKRVTHVLIKASAQVATSMERSDTASNQQIVRSIMVRM